MFSSAVSVVVSFALWGAWGQIGPQEKVAWDRLAPSLVTLMDGGSPRGIAVLIDSKGFFVAHKENVPAGTIRGVDVTGASILFHLQSTDDPSQLVLLRAEKWTSRAAPIEAADAQVRRGDRLIAGLGSGPIRAEFVSGDRIGVLSPSRRVVQLNEIRFEAPLSTVAGALVFTLDGRLVGSLNATLEQIDEAEQAPVGNGLARAFGGASQDKLRFGPAPMTVAYTVGPIALRRVFEGFRSPSHEVVYPSLGVFCRDADGKGAIVEMVQAGSPAHVAGIRPSDVIFELNGDPVRNQIDFARVVFEQEVGKVVSMRVRRGATTVLMMVRVGRTAPDSIDEHSGITLPVAAARVAIVGR